MAAINIKPILKQSGVALERTATGMFGNAVEDFTRGALGLPRGSASAGLKIAPSDTKQWYSTSYAAALAGGTDLRPKLKFLFKIEFRFRAGVLEELASANLLTSHQIRSIKENGFTFMVKSVDRPKVDFEYEEDVNYYNFRTKALKRIKHRSLTVAFMDDTGNRVFDFFRALMFIYSPVTRKSMKRTDPLKPVNVDNFQGGMNFNVGSALEKSANAHRGVINTAAGQAIEFIRVRQMFYDPAAGTAHGVDSAGGRVAGAKQNLYDFMNPRLESFDLDELTHESSDPSVLTMQFDYDWMEMVSMNQLLNKDGPRLNIYAPGVNGAPADVLDGLTNRSATAGYTAGSPSQGGANSMNPFEQVLRGVAGRAAQQVTRDIVGKAVGKIAGGGQLGNVLSGAIGGPLQSIISGPASNAAGGLFNLGKSAVSRVTNSRVGSDSAGSATVTGSSSASSDPGGFI